jgi:hypothetical protein
MFEPRKKWRSPEELVELGLARSRVVMMNEHHNGLKRSVRTRVIGKRVLPTAHAAGVRHLAMEALTPKFAARGGSAAFLVEDSSFRWFGVDAVILSLENELT